MTHPIRMVRCTYLPKGERWIPMGRARTRCPRCGAVVSEGPDASTSSHPVELRTPPPPNTED